MPSLPVAFLLRFSQEIVSVSDKPAGSPRFLFIIFGPACASDYRCSSCGPDA